MKSKLSTITVQNVEINIKSKNGIDYISLTDMTVNFDGSAAQFDIVYATKTLLNSWVFGSE